MVLGLKGHRSTLGLGLTVIRRGFELYECNLVLTALNKYIMMMTTKKKCIIYVDCYISTMCVVIYKFTTFEFIMDPRTNRNFAYGVS